MGDRAAAVCMAERVEMEQEVAPAAREKDDLEGLLVMVVKMGTGAGAGEEVEEEVAELVAAAKVAVV